MCSLLSLPPPPPPPQLLFIPIWFWYLYLKTNIYTKEVVEMYFLILLEVYCAFIWSIINPFIPKAAQKVSDYLHCIILPWVG